MCLVLSCAEGLTFSPDSKHAVEGLVTRATLLQEDRISFEDLRSSGHFYISKGLLQQPSDNDEVIFIKTRQGKLELILGQDLYQRCGVTGSKIDKRHRLHEFCKASRNSDLGDLHCM